jgi:hypothetical protein
MPQRDFTSWGTTGGSDVSKKLMLQVLEHIDEHAQTILVQRVEEHVMFLAKILLEEKNILCLCPAWSASIDCCIYSNRQDIAFKLPVDQQQTWDMSNNVIKDTFTHVLEAGILETLWINKIGDAVPLTQEQISETLTAHLFATSRTVAVQTYDIDNSLTVLNNVSLWEWCTGRITGIYVCYNALDRRKGQRKGMSGSRRQHTTLA